MLDKSVGEFSGALDFDLANCRMFVAHPTSPTTYECTHHSPNRRGEEKRDAQLSPDSLVLASCLATILS